VKLARRVRTSAQVDVHNSGLTWPDAAQLLDGRERDHALAGQLLGLLGELEQLDTRSDALLGPAERLRGAVLGQPAVQHRLLCEALRYPKSRMECPLPGWCPGMPGFA
jgi:hypothetical protein